MRVAVAGATGVLGRALVPQLLAAGHNVVGLVRDPQKAAALFPAAGIELKQCDLLARGVEQRLVELLRGCDAVIHGATAIPKNLSDPAAWEANTRLRTKGTGRLQRASLEAGVGTYLLQSIVMAYRDGGDAWLDESTWIDSTPERALICQPVAIMEAMMRLVKPDRQRWCILKGGSFVGPDTFQQAQLERLRRGEEVVPGDGSHFISPVHVEDVAAAFVLALERAPARSIFNICDEPVSYGEYVDRLADLIGAPRPPRDPSRPRPPSFRCSNQRARQVLGWTPTHSIWPSLHVQPASR